MEHEQAIQKLGEIIKGIQIAMLVTRMPDERSIASHAAWFGAHQFVGSPEKRCSMNDILGQPGWLKASRSSMSRSTSVPSNTARPGAVSV